MAKLDYNVLKEDPKEFEEYSNMLPEFERLGKFDVDQDPVVPGSFDPVDENFPYIRRGIKWAFKQAIYNHVLNYYTKLINKNLLNLKVEGRKNLKGVKSAIITCNHISKVDSFAVRGAVKQNIMFVAAEHNNWKGPLGEISRNTGYIALPGKLNLSLMRKFDEAISYYLNKGKKILIYPEQAMWREYKKPRPLKPGAFHYAVKNNVPVVPLFITIKEKAERLDEQNRVNFGDYTIHVLPPVYPKEELSIKDNEKFMRLENFRLWKECYEQTYNTKLTLATDKSIWDAQFGADYGNLLTNVKK